MLQIIASSTPVTTLPSLTAALDRVTATPTPTQAPTDAVCLSCGSYLPHWTLSPRPCPQCSSTAVYLLTPMPTVHVTIPDTLYSLHQQRGPILVSPPIQVRDHVVAFWEPATTLSHHPSTTSLHQYRRQYAPDGPWVLRPDIPAPGPTVLASVCHTCSRPRIAQAVMAPPSMTAWIPRAFCPDPEGSPPLLTRDAYKQGRVILPNGIVAQAINHTASPWGHPCTPSIPAPSLPPPYLLRTIPGTTFTPVSPALQTIRHVGANLGGIEGQVPLLRLWLHILSPDVVTFQEVWNFALLDEVLPSSMVVLCGSVSGQGRGLAIAWRRTLCLSGFDPAAARDTREDLAVALPTRQYGLVLAISAHLPPKLPDRARHAVMRAWSTLRTITNPRYALIQGDLNMPRDPGTPLEQALRPGGSLSAFSPALPRGTATNFIATLGVPAATCIDHLLVYGAWSDVQCSLLPLQHSHLAIVAELTPRDAKPDPFAWKRYRWRSTERDATRLLAVVLSIAWGSLAHTSASPNQFLDAFHHYAAQHARPRVTTRSLIDSLELPPPPYTKPQLRRIEASLRAQCSERELTSRRAALQGVCIDAVTKRHVAPPSKPLQVYSGIRPHPAAELPTAAAQLAETHRQAREIQCNRHVLVDHHDLERGSSSAPWNALFDPVRDLPLKLFLLALHRGYSPASTDSLKHLAGALASQGPLHPQLTHTALRRLTSWATTVDNFPPALLSSAEGGLQLACHRMLQLRHAGTTSISSMITQYGNYKGPQKPPHLFESHRPLSVASPLASFEAGEAGQLIRATMELSGAATPELFAYRAEIQPAYMAFAVRAAMIRTLLTWGTLASAKWDESHAYLRIPRAQAQRTLTLTPHVWNFAQWFQQYYSSRSIRILTDVGFTDPIVTEEGADQGCPAADQCFQGTQACLNTTLTTFSDISLPSTRGPLPCTRAAFSDDRIFLAPSLRRLVQAVLECVQCSRAVGRVPNPHKLEFYLVRLLSGTLHLVSTVVPDMDTTTKTDPPTLVGIPLLTQLPVRKILARLIPSFRRMGARLAAEDRMNPVLRIRAFHAYAMSSLDFVTHGALLPQSSLATLQVLSNRHYRRTYRLPKWTPLWFLWCPLHLGGAGCPVLFLRNVVQLTTTLLRAATNRHPLAQAGAQYLLHDGLPLSDTPILLHALEPYGFQLHCIPGPTLSPCLAHINGTTHFPPSVTVILLAYDAAVRDDRLGIAAVAWHPELGELFTFQMAFPTFKPTSSIAEWLARLLPLWHIGHWAGLVQLVTDSTTTCTHRFTRGPPERSVLALYFRHIMAACSGLRYHDLWVQAQHSTGTLDTLAQLNRRAHDLCQTALQKHRPRSIPLPGVLDGCSVGSIDGGTLFDPASTMGELYSRASSAPMGQRLRQWDAVPWDRMYRNGGLPEADVYRALQLRLYALSSPPPGVGCYPCPFCATSVHNLVTHIRTQCPYAYVALFRTACALWHSPAVLRAVHLTDALPCAVLEVRDGLTLCDVHTLQAFGVQLGAAVPQVPPTIAAMAVYSLGGLWYVQSSSQDAPPVTPADQAALMRLLSSTSGCLRPHQTLHSALRSVPITLAGRHIMWTAPTYPNTPSCTVLCPSSALTVQQSLVLNVVLRTLPWSALFMASAAALTLPASPSPEDKLFVICVLGATPQVWHRMQALSVGWCPRIYILPRSWCPSLEL